MVTYCRDAFGNVYRCYSSGISYGARAAIGIAIGVVFLIIVILLSVASRRRRRNADFNIQPSAAPYQNPYAEGAHGQPGYPPGAEPAQGPYPPQTTQYPPPGGVPVSDPLPAGTPYAPPPGPPPPTYQPPTKA